MQASPDSTKFSTRLAFGGAAVSGEGGGYGFGAISEQESIALLQSSFELGIRVFDTAPVYGFGTSERRIGKAFKMTRDQVTIISKSGVTWSPTKRISIDNSTATTERMLEESLRTLNTDYIDLYMIHWPDRNVDIRIPMERLAKAQASGKIHAIGLCNTNPEDFAKASEVATVSAVQGEYNLFQRDAERSLLPLVKELKIPFYAYGTLDKGILSGRVSATRRYDKCDARGWAPWWHKDEVRRKTAVVSRLADFLTPTGYSLLQIAIGHCLAASPQLIPLCGFRSEAQLRSGLNAAEMPLPPAFIDEVSSFVDKATTMAPATNPRDHHNPTAGKPCTGH